MQDGVTLGRQGPAQLDLERVPGVVVDDDAQGFETSDSAVALVGMDGFGSRGSQDARPSCTK